MNEIEINGVKYVPKAIAGEIKIMILQRGFVYVGRVTHDGDTVTISSAHNVRKWGTQRGLGQLAESGPTKDSILDPAGTVACHSLGVVAELSCNQTVWCQLCK